MMMRISVLRLNNVRLKESPVTSSKYGVNWLQHPAVRWFSSFKSLSLDVSAVTSDYARVILVSA